METQLAQDKNPGADKETQKTTSPQPEPLPLSSASSFRPQRVIDSPSNGRRLMPHSVRFTNGNEAQLVHVPPNTSAEAIIAALALEKPEALILISGEMTAMDDKLKAHLIQLFSRSLARTAAETRTIIFDEGRQTELTAITGQGVADRGYKSVLLGITREGKVSYPDSPEKASSQTGTTLEPHHSHFVLVAEEEKRSDVELMGQIAAALADGKPVVTILAGGDDLTKAQIVQSVRQGWPVLVIKESGGLADKITELWQQRPRPFIPEADLAEIIEEGRLYFFDLDDTIQGFQHLLKWLLKPHQASDQATLELAWSRFGMYDEAAKRQQKGFRSIQMWILVLGVVATLLALIQYTLRNNLVTPGVVDTYYYASQILFVVLLAVPITISTLIAAANRFSAGNKWIALRATAESIKKEIYLYRSHAENYSAAKTSNTSRETKLVRKIDALSSKLMQSEVNVSAAEPYGGPIPPKYGVAGGDDGFSFLTPDRYLNYRLQDQLDWYRNKTVRLEKQLYRLQWLVWIFGAIGTFLVAIGFELWIALTTALVGALTTYLEYQQVENTLIRYNQTATDLANIQSWWTALSPAEKADPKNTNKLVGQTETVIHTEHASWVKEQQDAMAELRAAQAEQSEPQTRANYLAGLSAGQLQQVKESLTSLSDFFEDSPPTSPEGRQVKESIDTVATLVESRSMSPSQAVQVLDQMTTRDELLEASAAQPEKDAQTQDSLSILSDLLDNQRLDTAQVQQTLSSLANLAQMVQKGTFSGGQIEKAIGSLSRLSHLFEASDLSATQLKKAMQSLPNLTYLIEPGTLTVPQIEKALGSLPSLVVMWESGKLSTGPIETVLASLPNLSRLVQQGELAPPQFEKVLINLPTFAQLAQPEILSSDRVARLLAAAEQAGTLAVEQVEKVLADLPRVIILLRQEEVSPERVNQLIDSVITLAILLEDKELSEEEVERVLDSLILLVDLLEEKASEAPPA